ncbi:glycosyltransferase family 4 protein [Spirulina major]|uniref:glycosyltransferase family 4 protein n=1 Tax=Spirulina major TaxID=270636 RepID=UPI000933088D|nr:glycosyltransferase family 4 protein [Spirulina major]
MISTAKKPSVVFLFEWFSNPYRELLVNHIKQNGCVVHEDSWQTFFIFKVLQVRPDILHLHALLPFIRARSPLTKLIKLLIFITQIIILRLLGIKTIWTVHEWQDKLGTDSGDIPKYHSKLIGICLHGFIVHSEATKHEIIKDFSLSKAREKKVFTIYHGNFIDYYENNTNPLESRERLGIQPDQFVFLLLGGLYRYKGILDAIHAFKQLNIQESYLIIAGKPGGEQGLVEEIMTQLKNMNNVLFIGDYIPDEDIQFYLNACDVVTVPYKVFTTSSVAVLAMSFGRACIAPKIGFFKDVPGKTGAFLFEQSDPHALCHSMQAAVDQRDVILAMGNHNLERAKIWGWDSVAQQTIAAYDS